MCNADKTINQGPSEISDALSVSCMLGYLRSHNNLIYLRCILFQQKHMHCLAILFIFLTLFFNDTYAIGPKTLGNQGQGLSSTQTLKITEGIGIDEHLGGSIDLDLEFENEVGAVVKLRDYFKAGKPIFLSLVYYNCPMLCNLQMNGSLKTFKQLKLNLGTEFDAILVSIDPNETQKLTSDKKKTYLKSYDRPDADKGWHFLRGKQENITALAKQVGFKYRYDDETSQYLHTAASYVITPDGRISYYHYGISMEPSVLRLSLIEASENKIGTVMERLVLFCLQYDPKKKGYSIYVMNIVRVLGAILVIVLGK